MELDQLAPVEYMGESFQDFEADFPWKVSLKILNYFFPAYLKI